MQHCAVEGKMETAVRTFSVGDVGPYAQHGCSVWVQIQRPRKSVKHTYHIVPDNIRYLTIEVEGRVVYDSRGDVPCDMTEWLKTNDRFRSKVSRTGRTWRVDQRPQEQLELPLWDDAEMRSIIAEESGKAVR